MRTTTYPARAALAASILALVASASAAEAQWVQQSEQFYLPASHNWVFRDNYAGADRLFNAFDYGHAILYEELYTRPEGPVERLEVDEYDFVTQKLLKNPPRVPLEEAAIEIAYVKMAPEAKQMFEWAHLMHRQLYDVLADERLTAPERDAAVAEVIAYYKSRPDLAFSSVPKSMDIMDGQHYSLAFRERYPKFNGLIWAYHWLQVGLYEPLMVNDGVVGRSKGVSATVGRFWQMLEEAPANMPHLMPMTSAVAPTFSARYPEAAIIFDNLHMMHDVISDILASNEVPRERKRAEILRAAEMFRDETSYAIPIEEWAMMGEMMGVNNMGGEAAGFLPDLPTPTVAYGASMAGMEHGAAGAEHAGMDHGADPADGAMDHGAMDHGAMPGMDHEGHMAEMMEMHERMMGAGAAGHEAMDHEAHMAEMMEMHERMTGDAAAGDGAMDHGATPGMDHEAHMAEMMEMHERMMADPVIRARIEADPELKRMITEMEARMHRADPSTPPAAHDAALGGTEEVRALTTEFIVRLLSDPEVEASVHSDPELHRLWSDPEVQARLAELRSAGPAAGARPPAATDAHVGH